MVYKGCEVPHHRLEFTGTWYTQMFLHYIDGTNEGKPWNGEATPNVFLEKTENLWANPKTGYTQNLLNSIPIPDPKKERARLIDRAKEVLP